MNRHLSVNRRTDEKDGILCARGGKKQGRRLVGISRFGILWLPAQGSGTDPGSFQYATEINMQMMRLRRRVGAQRAESGRSILYNETLGQYGLLFCLESILLLL